MYTDTLIRSTGSGSNIDKLIAASPSDLLANVVSGIVIDANHQPPGIAYIDSLRVQLVYPNGSGGLTAVTTAPDTHGRFNYPNIPIGNHVLRVIYVPASDTMSYQVAVCPGRNVDLEIVFPADLW